MTSVSVTLSDGKGSSIKSSRMTPETMSREVGLMVLESVQSTHFREKFSFGLDGCGTKFVEFGNDV